MTPGPPLTPPPTLGLPGVTELDEETTTPLFEVLSYDWLLEDAGVNRAAAAALLHLSVSHDLALAEGGGRYRGLYRLAAHPNPQVLDFSSLLLVYLCDA